MAFLPLKYRYLITIVLVIIIGIGAYSFYAPRSLDVTDTSDVEPGQEDWIREIGRINILLLGTDEDLGTKTRTDTIILASLDMENKKVSLLSIPRDTRVNIPGFGENRINSANVFGGVDLVKTSISNLIKVPIDYYVLTNFEGFKGIIDILGGVEIDVEQNMKYRVYDGMIDLKKGLQRLDGAKSLQYVRFRHDKLGDITRTQRQQKFLTALAKEMLQAKNIVKLPVLIPKLNEAVKTDLTITQMIGLAQEFGKYDLSSITVQTLPGNFVDLNGGSYWYVDKDKVHQVVLEVFAGKSADIIDNDIKVNKGSNSSNKVVDTPPPSKSPEKIKEVEPEIPVDNIPATDETIEPLPPEVEIIDIPIDDSTGKENNEQVPEVPSDPIDNVEEIPPSEGDTAPVNTKDQYPDTLEKDLEI